MPTKIDLHMHSDFSDGRISVEEVIKTAANNGVEVLALPDHDSINNLEAVTVAAQQFNVKFIPAVEITTSFRGRVLHILGYNFDPTDKDLLQAFDALLYSRKQGVINRMKQVKHKLHRDGKGDLDPDHFVESQKGFFNRWKAVDYLLEHRLVDSREEGLNSVAGIKISHDDISPEQAIKLVHQAGGKTVLAHPFGPKISLPSLTKDIEEQENILAMLKESGLDGIECYQPSHEPEGIERALRAAKKFDLIVSAGSDWHGPLELAGKGILEYIPNYTEGPGLFDVPERVQQRMTEFFIN